ncbi:hypothetical protein BDB01DRAFT_789140 [Pilobolus umbonatus]|nr:hypothetical protein BDB01DRAFT_789140 [Pilobolus umbonatus]
MLFFGMMIAFISHNIFTCWGLIGWLIALSVIYSLIYNRFILCLFLVTWTYTVILLYRIEVMVNKD